MIRKIFEKYNSLFLFLPLFLIIFLHSTLYSDKEFIILDLNGSKHSTVLLDLLEKLNIKHNGTAQNIVEVTQKTMLRPTGKERWEIEDIFKDKRDLIYEDLKKLGCIEAIYPHKKYYDYALLLGAVVPTMRSRLEFLVKLWEDGLRFKKLVFLVGNRPLDENLESKEVILNHTNLNLPLNNEWKFSGELPKTESEAAKLIWDQSDLPKEMKETEIIFVDTPMQADEKGSLKRPTTDDTVKLWLSKNPVPGSCIAISNQPFIKYQHSVLRRLLPSSFYLETVGAKVSEDKSIAVIIDSIARWIYSEFMRLKSKNDN